MRKFVISIQVQVEVEANSERQAEDDAFKRATQLIREPTAHVSSARLVREIRR